MFHFLIEQCVAHWDISYQRPQLSRLFNHGTMKQASSRIANQKLSNPNQTQRDLQTVAGLFVELQDARHSADYDNAEIWTSSEVETMIQRVEAAFAAWQAIGNETVALNYLLSLLAQRP